MKPPPVWLAEFHRQWHAARGRRTAAAARAFSRDWPRLLEDAGLTAAADQATATREAEALEAAGHLVLRRHRYRKYLIDRVSLPATAEPWLRDLFGGTPGHELLQTALEIIADFSRLSHPRFPGEWSTLCERLHTAFHAGRSPRPFRWTHPTPLRALLETLARLTAHDWPPGTLVRNASIDCGLESKGLERRQRMLESGLTRLFGTRVTFTDLGLVSGESHVELHGPLRLHFPDGSHQDFAGLHNILISAADIARCSHITTSAHRLLSIENRKTTFREAVAANADRHTLLTTTSFPTPAFRQLLEKLPPNLPHSHFGDTDPAGWLILLKLREATPRSVAPLLMRWRPATSPTPPTPYDLRTLPLLMEHPLLADVRHEISRIADRSDRGDFEQETLSPIPWPQILSAEAMGNLIRRDPRDKTP